MFSQHPIARNLFPALSAVGDEIEANLTVNTPVQVIAGQRSGKTTLVFAYAEYLALPTVYCCGTAASSRNIVLQKHAPPYVRYYRPGIPFTPRTLVIVEEFLWWNSNNVYTAAKAANCLIIATSSRRDTNPYVSTDPAAYVIKRSTSDVNPNVTVGPATDAMTRRDFYVE